MIDINPASENEEVEEAAGLLETRADKTPWETPRLEDVSDEVMAQPYIRFT